MALTSEERVRSREYSKTAQERAKQNPKPCVNGCGKNAAPRRKLCYTCKNAEWRDKNPEYNKTNSKYRRDRIKLEVIDLYGGKCACCGESEPMFLTLDHVIPLAESGEKRATGGSRQWYDGRKRHGDGYYQLMCFNCNFAKYWGGCPHQTP